MLRPLLSRASLKDIAVMWCTLSGVCGIGILLFVIDSIPLGPNFELVVAVSLTGAAIIALALALLLPSAIAWLKNRVHFLSIPLRSRLNTLIILGIVILAVIGGGSYLTFSMMAQHSRTVTDAKSAREHFVIVEHGRDIDQSKVNQTLAEFERARVRLEGEWSMPETSSPIELHLYQDLQDYHARTGRERSVGSMRCQANGAVVFVPVEEARGVLTEHDHTRTPMHEMAHAVMCQVLGERAFRSISAWLHEGMAEIYAREGRHQRPQRVVSRLLLWIMTADSLTPEAFCNGSPRGPHVEMKLFYRTAPEFVRWLRYDHGEDALSALMEDVRQGVAFEDSLRDHLGGTCVELYRSWLMSW